MEFNESVDEFLINCVKEYPSLYNADVYSVADERDWDELQKTLGIQSILSCFAII